MQAVSEEYQYAGLRLSFICNLLKQSPEGEGVYPP